MSMMHYRKHATRLAKVLKNLLEKEENTFRLFEMVISDEVYIIQYNKGPYRSSIQFKTNNHEHQAIVHFQNHDSTLAHFSSKGNVKELEWLFHTLKNSTLPSLLSHGYHKVEDHQLQTLVFEKNTKYSKKYKKKTLDIHTFIHGLLQIKADYDLLYRLFGDETYHETSHRILQYLKRLEKNLSF